MNRGIKFCIMSRLIGIVLIVLLAFALVSSLAFQSINQTNIAKRGSYDAQKNLMQIENAIEEIYRLSEILSLNTEVRRFISTKEFSSPSQKTVQLYHLMNSLDQNILFDQYIHSFCLVDKQGNGYWDDCPYDDYFMEWFERQVLRGEPSKNHLGFTKSYAFSDKRQYRRDVELISSISNIYSVQEGSLHTIGQVIINLNLSSLMSEVFAKNSLFSQIGILNDQDHLLYLSSGEETDFFKNTAHLTGDFNQTADGYYFLNTTTNTRWKIISFLPNNQITETMNIPFFYIIAGVILLAIVLLFTFVFPVLLNISRQIIALDHAMDLVANGDLEISVSLYGIRELQSISNGFNRMLLKTNRYMKESLRYLEEKEKVSFELLLAKMNPHFIYNTLNSVIYLARQNRCQDVIQLTSAFIYLLQDSIHLEENSLFCPVKTELEVIEKYITIQKYRYANQFTFTMMVETALESSYIPKNILQPLIENAIIHGVCPTGMSGHITLHVKQRENQVQLVIEDDGIGMDQGFASSLLDFAHPTAQPMRTSKMRAIGIQNIAEKLYIIYGNKHHIGIRSAPSCGTTIKMVLPLHTQEPVATQLPHNQA